LKGKEGQHRGRGNFILRGGKWITQKKTKGGNKEKESKEKVRSRREGTQIRALISRVRAEKKRQGGLYEFIRVLTAMGKKGKFERGWNIC